MLNRRSFFRWIAASVVTVAVTPLVKIGLVSQLTFDELVARALRKRSSEIANNVMRNNALYQRIEDG